MPTEPKLLHPTNFQIQPKHTNHLPESQEPQVLCTDCNFSLWVCSKWGISAWAHSTVCKDGCTRVSVRKAACWLEYIPQIITLSKISDNKMAFHLSRCKHTELPRALTASFIPFCPSNVGVSGRRWGRKREFIGC